MIMMVKSELKKGTKLLKKKQSKDKARYEAKRSGRITLLRGASISYTLVEDVPEVRKSLRTLPCTVFSSGLCVANFKEGAGMCSI